MIQMKMNQKREDKGRGHSAWDVRYCISILSYVAFAQL